MDPIRIQTIFLSDLRADARERDAECLRVLSAMAWPGLAFAPALAADARGLVEYLGRHAVGDPTPWVVLIGQRPGALAGVVGRLLGAVCDRGGRVLYYSYDDASHAMACHAAEVAPHVSVLIHDELPLASAVAGALRTECVPRHMSWVATTVPFGHAFEEQAEPRIVFLGSPSGLTEHRQRQLAAMAEHFGDRFTAVTDGSASGAEHADLARAKVHLCPEGRKFTTPAMSQSHTDRPFRAGCLGQVPVIENSLWGGRLEHLASRGLVLRYAHGDLRAMIERCEQALELPATERRGIYEYFNRHGTVGTVVAREIARFHGLAVESGGLPPARAGAASTR